jgi:hypothetical protein
MVNYSPRSRTGNGRRKTFWCLVKMRDGYVINVENTSVHVGAQVLMLAADPETYAALRWFSPITSKRRETHAY